MTTQQQLAAHLENVFEIKVHQRGIHSVYIEETSAYKHVHLELNTFLIGEMEFKKIFDACQRFNYKFYVTPRTERRSDSRHFITFYQ
jgi:hypothetical protein